MFGKDNFTPDFWRRRCWRWRECECGHCSLLPRVFIVVFKACSTTVVSKNRFSLVGQLADEKEEEKATVGCFWFSGDISVLHSQLTRSTSLRQRIVAEENELAGWLYWGGKESCPCKGKVHRDNEITWRYLVEIVRLFWVTRNGTVKATWKYQVLQSRMMPKGYSFGLFGIFAEVSPDFCEAQSLFRKDNWGHRVIFKGSHDLFATLKRPTATALRTLCCAAALPSCAVLAIVHGRGG